MSSSHSPEREPLLSQPQAANGLAPTGHDRSIASQRAARTNVVDHTPNADDGQSNTTGESPELSEVQILWKLSGMFLGSFVGALDSTLVAVISASISSSFSDMPLLGWLASAFFIASAASQPIAGKLTDIYGRRNCLLFVSALFGLGNVLCACAQTEWQLLSGRAVAGLGGGAFFPICSIVTSDYVPLRKRGVWQGFGNIVFGVGSGVGGTFGGWISDILNWRWAFAVQVPITIVSMILITVQVRPLSTTVTPVSEHKSKFRRIDFIGAALLVTSIVLMLLGLTSGGNIVPWTHPLVLVALPASLVALAAFVVFEHKLADEPIFPVKLLTNRTVAAVSSTTWFTTMARFGFLFYGPVYFQIRGYTAAQTGLRFIPESVAIAIASITCGIIMRATGKYYALNLFVQILLPIALALIATLSLTTPAWPPFIYIALIGLSYSGMLTTTLLALLAAVEQQYVAVITSISYVFRSTGSIVGISIASAVYQNTLRRSLHNRLDHLDDGDEIIREVQESLSNIFKLPDPVRETVQQAYMDSLHLVYLTLFVIAVVGVVCGALMREHPLSSNLSRRPSQ